MPEGHRKVSAPKSNLLTRKLFFIDPEIEHPWMKTLSPLFQEKDRGPFHLKSSTYPLYYEIGAVLRPKTILEVGVRYGYSLASLASGAQLTEGLFGIDFEGYEQNSVKIASANLKSLGINATIEYGDSHKFDVEKVFGKKYFDLIHIDGDHTADGALLDLIKFSKFTNTLLVDDALDARVWRAVSAFITSKDDPISVTYLPSGNGLLIIEY